MTKRSAADVSKAPDPASMDKIARYDARVAEQAFTFPESGRTIAAVFVGKMNSGNSEKASSRPSKAAQKPATGRKAPTTMAKPPSRSAKAAATPSVLADPKATKRTRSAA